jgi:hypothetical protein
MLPMIFRNGNGPGHFLQALQMDDDHRALIGTAPDNRPMADTRYVCFVAILDYWRLDPARCAAAGVPHFAAAIEAAVIADVRAGRALLVLDLSNEGPEFQKTFFDAIHEFLDRHDIPARHAVWLSQNRAIAQAYHSAYRDVRAQMLRFECYDYYIKLTASWFASAAWRAEVTGDADAYAAALNDPAGKRRFALCLNATPRLHRVWTLAALRHYRVLEHCLVSFGGLAYEKGAPLDPAWVQAALAHWQLQFLQPACAAVIADGTLRIDGFAATGNALVDKIDIAAYLATWFSIVTETDFTDGTIDRITEKTVKVFCLGHPAIVVGNPGAIRLARSLGFQDFAPALPSGYDTIAAPPIRFAAVLAEILAQIVAIQREPKAWLGRVAESSRFNIRHASGGLLRAYKDGHDKRVVESLARWLAAGPS